MRVLAMGHSALMDGFALLGMETWPDAGVEEVDQLLKELLRNKERAMIYLQSDLARADSKMLQMIRNEGGDVLVCEIPDLLSADEYRAPVEQLIARVLGANAAKEVSHG